MHDTDAADPDGAGRGGDAEDCLAGWCADDDWCAITCTAEVVGRKWHPVIVHRLLDGPQGFADLEDAIPEVSSTVLSDSLADLEAKGVLERRVVSEQPFRVEYALTGRGRSLEPVIDAMAAWGHSEHAPDDRDHPSASDGRCR